METISRDEVADRAWLAGLFDGEGYLGFCHNNSRGMAQVKWQIKMSCPWAIQKATRILSIWKINFHIVWEKRSDRGWKETLSLTMGGSRTVKKVLENTLPYLTTKKDEALCMLDYLRWRLDEMPLHMGRVKHGGYSSYGGRNLIEEVSTKRSLTDAKLKAIRARRFSFQRLPRRPSEMLNLSNLEVMV